VSTIVIDASVAVKWFLPEPHAEAARRVLSGRREFLAPDLIWAEVGNVLWKKSARAEISSEVACAILRDFRRFPLQTYTAGTLLDPAWDLAVRFRISVYDSLYLALAVNRDCKLLTADRQFYDTLKRTPFASTLVWVEQMR